MDKDKSPQNILDEIFAKSEKAAPPPPPPEQTAAEQAAPAPPAKNSGRVYLFSYLAILFGAAFLVLLAFALRWRDTAAQVEPLTEKIIALQSEKEQLEKQLEETQERSAWLEDQTKQAREEYTAAISRFDQTNLLDCLEQAVETGDYLMAAVMIQDIDVIFNRRAPSFDNQYLIPAQERQYLALRDTVFHNGAITLSRTATTEGVENHADEEKWGGHYVERVDVANGRFDQAELDTAGYLYGIFRDYPINPGYAAQTIAEQFQPNGIRMTILNSGAFQPATVERFEKIKAELLEWALRVELTGELSIVCVYGDAHYGTPEHSP